MPSSRSLTNRGSDAPPLLLKAARRLEGIDVELARATYLDVLIAASMAGRAAEPHANLTEVAHSARSVPQPPGDPGPIDLLLDGLVTKIVDGYAAALPTLRAALVADTSGMPPDKELRWLSLAYRSAMDIWDDKHAVGPFCSRRRPGEEAGALSEDADGPARTLTAETVALADWDTATPAVTGSGLSTTRPMDLASYRPHGRRASRLRRSGDVYGPVVEYLRGEVGSVGPR